MIESLSSHTIKPGRTAAMQRRRIELAGYAGFPG